MLGSQKEGEVQPVSQVQQGDRKMPMLILIISQICKIFHIHAFQCIRSLRVCLKLLLSTFSYRRVIATHAHQLLHESRLSGCGMWCQWLSLWVRAQCALMSKKLEVNALLLQ